MRGWTVTDVLEENDTSASGKKRRPLYENLLAMIEARQVDVVIAYQMDRLTRSLGELEHLIALSERTGVKVATAAGDIDLSTEAGRLVGRILASVARSEIEVKARRHRDAQAQAAAEGRRVGGRRPFGYEQDGMTIRPREAAAIRQGFEDILAGLPLAEIARRWNSLGLRSQSREWSWDNVRVVLLNPRYAGLRAHKGEVVGPAVWDALVPEETWRAAVGVLKDPARRRGAGPKRPLTGIALCGYPYRSWDEWKEDSGAQACGAHLHAGGAARKYKMYRCSGTMGHIGRKSEPVEEYITEVVFGRLLQPDAVGFLVDDDRPDVGELRVEAMSLRQRLDDLAGLFAEGALTGAQLREGTARARRRLEEIELLMADAGRVDVLGDLVRAPDRDAMAELWEEYSVARRAAVVDTLMEVWVFPPGRGTRIFRPETVGVRWR